MWCVYVYIYTHIYVYIYIYIYMECYSAIKKEWNNAVCSNIDIPRDYHTKWSKSERERQIPYDTI